jgi:hypothetical protein
LLIGGEDDLGYGVTSRETWLEYAVPSEPLTVKAKDPMPWKPAVGWNCAVCLSAASVTVPFCAAETA